MNSNKRRVCAQTHGDAHRSSIHLAGVQFELHRSFIARRSHPRRAHCPRTPPCARQLRRAAYDALRRAAPRTEDAAPNAACSTASTAIAFRWINSTSSLLIARTTRSSTIARRSFLRARTRSARPRDVLVHTHTRLALAGAPSSGTHHGLARAQPSVLDAHTRSAHTLNTTRRLRAQSTRSAHTHHALARTHVARHEHTHTPVAMIKSRRWVYSQHSPPKPSAIYAGHFRAEPARRRRPPWPP